MQPKIDKHNKESDGQSFEKRVLKLFLTLSVFIHLLFLILDPTSWLPRKAPLAPEWVIETELVGDFPLSSHKAAPSSSLQQQGKPSADKSEPSPPVEKKAMLPQLPKKFALKEEQKAPSSEDKHSKKSSPAGEQPAASPKEPDDEKLSVKKDEEATELFKKDLMARLLKEQERKNQLARKKEEKQKAAEEKEKKILAAKLAKLRSEAQGKLTDRPLDESHPYIRAVKGYIYENYSIPEVYNFTEANAPIVLFIVNSRGDLVQSDIYQSSNNIALDKYALRSIQEAAAFFPKPPPEIIGRPIQIRFIRKI